MSLLYTFDVRGDRKFNLYANATFVSNTYHKVVKHCFEETFLSGSKKYIIGFSNNNENKVCISYMGQGKGDRSPHLFNKWNKNGTYTHMYTIIDANEGDSVLVCYDSANKILTAYTGGLNQSMKSTLEDKRAWYLFIQGNKDDSLTTLSLNIGYEPFVNTIPDGFAPYINGMIFPKQTLRCLNNRYKSIVNYFMLIAFS